MRPSDSPEQDAAATAGTERAEFAQFALENLFDISPDAIVVTDASGRIRAANPRSAELFGYTQGELNGKSIEDLVPERFRISARCSNYVERRERLRVRDVDGRLHAILDSRLNDVANHPNHLRVRAPGRRVLESEPLPNRIPLAERSAGELLVDDRDTPRIGLVG